MLSSKDEVKSLEMWSSMIPDSSSRLESKEERNERQEHRLGSRLQMLSSAL